MFTELTCLIGLNVNIIDCKYNYKLANRVK